MKWGVRRYQNKDGSLTAAGKKRVSKEYLNYSKKVGEDLSNQYDKMYVNAYNKAANHMNEGGIDKFNAEQRKKYGKDYSKRDGYEQEYEAVFDKVFGDNFNRSLNDFYKNNQNMKKCQELVDKYEMVSWNDLAKSNAETIRELEEIIRKLDGGN